MKRARPSAAILAAVLLAGQAAAREDCDADILPRAFNAAMAPSANWQQLTERVAEVNGYIEACPDHAWINMVGADFDGRIYDSLVELSGGQVEQQALDFVLRGFERSARFHEADADGRADRVFTSSSGTVRLGYSDAAAARKKLLGTLVDLARRGAVHPYIAATEPQPCTGWYTHDAQAISFAVQTKADLFLLPFVDAAAESCRKTGRGSDRLPLALQASVYTRLVRSGEISDPADARQMLAKAKVAETAYLEGGRSYDIFWAESDARNLDAKLRELGLTQEGAEAAVRREDWFTAENIARPEVVRGLALALAEKWTATAAGESGASDEAVTSARGALTGLVLKLRSEGTAAGIKAQTNLALREALIAVHEGTVRAPGTEGLPGFPKWYHDLLLNLLKPDEN